MLLPRSPELKQRNAPYLSAKIKQLAECGVLDPGSALHVALHLLHHTARALQSFFLSHIDVHLRNRRMAPDVNSLPSSPRTDRQRPQPNRVPSDTISRRTSTQMPPPPPPMSAHNPRSPIVMSNEAMAVPLRHPRPLTAAELYLECEKEQEAVVRPPNTTTLSCIPRLIVMLGQPAHSRTHGPARPECLGRLQPLALLHQHVRLAPAHRHLRPEPSTSAHRRNTPHTFTQT